ncbi:MAG: PIN domain-containing protein [Nitrososphaerota archaeon]|nr:PIN domain-containing protein [Nitrososphaerota archaeon]
MPTEADYIRSAKGIAVKIVADAYAWIELFAGTRKGEFAKSKMEEAETVITPDTVLAEVARKYIREGITEETARQRLSIIMEASVLAYIDDAIAIEAGKAYLQLERKAKDAGLKKPSLFDALVLAVARNGDGKVLTGDEHFEGLPETIWMNTL